jgi:osmotically-inducible protein OsmY
MKARFQLIRTLGVVFVAGTIACTSAPETAGDDTMAATDPAITASIQSKYFVDRAVKGIAIDVDTSNGVVTLEGAVETDAQKARAVDIARQTDGVTRVDDRLEIRADVPGTAERMAEATGPAWITTKVESRYFLDPDVKGRDIDVMTATDGTVTLHGMVETAAVKQRALSLARETEGVTSVVDEIVVGTAQPLPAEPVDENETSDAWITTKIQARFFVDPDVKGRNIDVTTANGVVTLNGTVENAAERREAVEIARDTDGVTNVTDQLRVAPSARTETTDDPNTGPASDAWLTTKIQAQYFADPDVSALAIDVTTKDRVVTLEGEVSSASEKSLAESIARETKGVDRVVNQLIVQ